MLWALVGGGGGGRIRKCCANLPALSVALEAAFERPLRGYYTTALRAALRSFVFSTKPDTATAAFVRASMRGAEYGTETCILFVRSNDSKIRPLTSLMRLLIVCLGH